MRQIQKYYVLDCGFNRQWYPDLIGKILDAPPAYAACATILVNA